MIASGVTLTSLLPQKTWELLAVLWRIKCKTRRKRTDAMEWKRKHALRSKDSRLLADVQLASERVGQMSVPPPPPPDSS